MSVPVDGKKKSPLVKILGGGCILLVLFIIVIAGCSAIFMSGGGEEPASAPAAPVSVAEEEAPAEEEAEPVEDAEAEEPSEEETVVEEVSDIPIVVDEVVRTKTIGMSGMEDTAQGEYVVVYITATNESGEPVTIDGDGFTLIGVDGTQYGVSSDWPITDDPQIIYEDVNPGNSVSGYILFDVPEGTELASMQYEEFLSLDGPTEIALP